ncbi:hypothetical protein STEG23_035511, partial [Scotinomys teguina]
VAEKYLYILNELSVFPSANLVPLCLSFHVVRMSVLFELVDGSMGKALVTKADDLSLSSRIHMVGKEK